MPDLPDFLPDLLCLDGNWEDYILPLLYGVFERDFKMSNLCFRGLPVGFSDKLDRGKEESFWHITHKDKSEKGKIINRIFDPERSKRIHWVRPVIENHSEPCIKCWDYEEGDKRIRTYLWLEEQDFLVILEKRPKKYYLVTVFYVCYEKKREDLREKYKKRL
jgi:hypothetical protein